MGFGFYLERKRGRERPATGRQLDGKKRAQQAGVSYIAGVKFRTKFPQSARSLVHDIACRRRVGLNHEVLRRTVVMLFGNVSQFRGCDSLPARH